MWLLKITGTTREQQVKGAGIATLCGRFSQA
jgi:hypothetical protein